MALEFRSDGICSCGRRIAHHVLSTTSTFPKSYKVVSHVLDGLVPWRNNVHVRCTYTVRDDDTRERLLYVDVPAESVLCMRFAKKGSLSWSDGTGCPFVSSSQYYELPCKVSSDYLVGVHRHSLVLTTSRTTHILPFSAHFVSPPVDTKTL